jgi:nitrate/TMAO reductase-like tetraheme cytochrome c subunit
MRNQIKYLVNLSKNTVSLLGVGITTISAILMMVLFTMEFLDYLANPYVGILTYLILPIIFITGLLVIPLGIWLMQRRRQRLEVAGEELPPLAYPAWDFNDHRIRKTALIVVLATVANVVVLSTATYKGVHHMESVEFCGTVCHTVMQPEFTSYQGSPHSRVACTSCHIGPGASWFVKSKLSGVRQVFAVAFNTYRRPIATPVHNLRPARETCEQCHWPAKFHDAKVRVIQKYSDDERNSPLTTALLLKVGGSRDNNGNGSGIHWWHMDPMNKVSYIADEKRETMYSVEHRNSKGEITEYQLADSKMPPQELAKLERRVMDCVDCHNRPTHIYRLPEESVDTAIAKDQIDRSLPFVKKKGVDLLKAVYTSEAEAHAQIDKGLREFYQKEHPQVLSQQQTKVDAAVRALQGIYSRNVFPKMQVTWGTYPNNLGHQNFPGCFRCHDDNHKSQVGKAITQDCSACHDLLAMDEEKPQLIPEILQSKTSESKP